MIAALQVSLDGFTQGANGEKDWADSWASALDLIPDVDTFVLGGHMYRITGSTWKSIDANPERVPPFQERLPSKGEVAYTDWLPRHVTLFCRRPWRASRGPEQRRIIRDVADLRALKSQPGKNMYVVGGATLVASLLNEDLIDELRLIVHPIVLGKGQALFSGVNKRFSLNLVEAKWTESGRVILTYRTANVANSAIVSDLSRCYRASAVGI